MSKNRTDIKENFDIQLKTGPVIVRKSAKYGQKFIYTRQILTKVTEKLTIPIKLKKKKPFLLIEKTILVKKSTNSR